MVTTRKSLATTKGKDTSHRAKSFVTKDGLTKPRNPYKNNGKISKYQFISCIRICNEYNSYFVSIELIIFISF